MNLTERVRAAHADAWAAEGRARAALGGGTHRVQDARAMASGIPEARWNNADITGADPDIGALHAWYRELGMPWGVRVPEELAGAVTVGVELFVKRGFALDPSAHRPATHTVAATNPDAATNPATNPDAAVAIERASPDQVDRFVAAEMALFGEAEQIARAWIMPVFGRDGFQHWFATREDQVVAIATTVRTDEVAGPALMVTGLDSLVGEDQARRQLARAVVMTALEDQPDTLVHVHTGPGDDPDDLTGLGLVEVAGLVVRSVSDGT